MNRQCTSHFPQNNVRMWSKTYMDDMPTFVEVQAFYVLRR